MEAEIASPRKHKRGREDAELSKRRKHHGHGHSHSHGHGDGRGKNKDHERHHHKHKRRRSHSRSRHARVSETSPARVCKDDMEEGEIVDEDDSGFESGEIQPEQPTASPKRESEKVKHARRSSKGVSSQDSSAKDTEPFAKALAVDVLGESPSIDIEEKGNSNSLDDTDGLARQGRNPCNTVSDDRYGDNVKHSEVQENGLDFKGKRKHSTSGLQEDGREKHRMRTESTPGLQEDGREKHRVRTELHLTSTGSERERRSSQLDPRLPPKSSETWKRSINPDEDRDRHGRHIREEDKHARHRDSHKDVEARSDLERDRYRANSTSNSGLERRVPDTDKDRLQSLKHHKGSEIKTNGSDESFAEKTNQIQKNDPFDITSKCYDIGKEERTDRKLKEERTDRELSPSYKYHDRHSARNVYKDKELYKEKDRKRHSHSQERSRAYDDKPKRSRSGERSRPYHDKPKRSRSRERAGSNREYRSRSRDRAGNSRQHRSRSRDQARHSRERRSRSHDRRAGHIIDHRSRSYDRESREYVYSSRHRRSNSRSRGGRHEDRMGDRNYKYSHRKESDIIQEKDTHSLMDKKRKEDGLNDEDRPADSENQEEYQFAEQEEDDVEKIKEESRKRRQAILEKYRQLNHTAHNVTSVSEVTEGEVNVKGAAVIPGNMASQQEQTNVTCPGSQDENDMFASESTFSISKEKMENGKLPVEIKDSENGLGKGSPKGETSGDVFYDDIFGESPAGVCKTGKCDGKPVDTSGLNDNWDDGEGYYCYRIGEVLDGRFEILASQGKGVFSSVVRAKNLKPAKGEPEEVAIKIIRNNETMYKAGQEELIILKKLASSDPDDKRHCVKFISSFKYRNHLCLVFESLHMNLREVLKKFGRDVGLNLTAVRAYAKQMFIALKHLKNCGVLHCDIKPDNILVNEAKKVLKLCDFGNAMFAGKNEITPYLVSRFYRAPEIIIGLPYDHALDIWSVGCCLFELYVGKVLFPGPSNNDMLRLHMELKGPFPKKMLRKAAFSDQHFDQDFNFHSTEEDPVTKKMVKRLLPNIKHKDINSLITRFSGEDPKMMANFKDLLDKIFTLDPDKRITVSQALSHPFITGK